MICESYPWKQDLLKRRNIIKQYNTAQKTGRDSNDTVYTAMEKGIFYSAFIIRKLIDCSVKLSDEVDGYKMPVECYTPTKQFDISNHWPDENSHDWNHSVTKHVYGRNVCNWLIHSFIFAFCYNEDKTVEGFFVASDFDRNKVLYYIRLSDWLAYVDFVANDDIVELHIMYNAEKGEREVKLKRRG